MALKKWPKSTYFSFLVLIGLTVFHAASGTPAALKILSGTLKKRNGEKAVVQSEKWKRREKFIRAGAIATSLGLLVGGLFIIGGRFGRDHIRVPLRPQYLKAYGRLYPESWVRY